MQKKSTSKSNAAAIDGIINEIKSKSIDGDYIYRGERKVYEKVSSSLYRECAEIDIEEFDLIYAQKEMLKIARNHMGESPVGPLEDFIDIMNKNKERMGWEEPMEEYIGEDISETIGETIAETAEREILTELQHYGGKTNLIDFTTDYFIAIYFACSGHPEEAGRVILLKKNEDIENMIIRPRNPRHRIIAQKSVFLHPPRGYIEVSEDNTISIPADIKQLLLDYLRKYHDISTESIYNDLYGFIRYQNIHQNAYVQFYMGLTFQLRALETKSPEKRELDYKKAIGHYNDAINLNPDIDQAYYNRGECWLHLQEWEKTKEDLTIAQNMGIDIVDSFRNAYEDGVKEFEEKRGIVLPPDIARILGDIVEDWTIERFYELLSSQKYSEYYESRNQTEKLSEFGTDLIDLVEKKQWELTPQFNKYYFALYFGRRRVFGVSLHGRPKLTVWLPDDVLAECNNDLLDDRYTYIYPDSHRCGIYPEHVTVTDIEELLEFAYLWHTDLLV